VNHKVLQWVGRSVESSEILRQLMETISESAAECDDKQHATEEQRGEGNDDINSSSPPARRTLANTKRSPSTSPSSMMSILSAAEASSKQSGSSSVEFEVFACRSNYDPRFGIENSAAAMSKFQRASIEHALVTSPFGKIFRMIAVLETEEDGDFNGGDDQHQHQHQHQQCQQHGREIIRDEEENRERREASRNGRE
jgi:hypothetical protein